jgi:transcriptional regulator with XRE-family HTH domain
MGKAGQALRQILESYNISQSLLAKGLSIECPIVFRWFHEQTDPTAETVAEIVKALYNINSSAARDFVEAYLGNLTHISQTLSTQELPQSERVNVSVLAQIFNNTTNSYKYLFFLSLLDILKRRHFDTLSPISFEKIIIEMLANAWYPHTYFKLSFGTQDQLANKLDSLDLEVTEPILKFRDTDKKVLRKIIQAQNLDDIIAFIGKYVPFRLIRPFFAQETRGLLDAKVNQSIIHLANNQFEVTKPIYYFNSEYLKDCTGIVLHQGRVEYIAENYSIVRGWIFWEWLGYMQKCNPSVPAVYNKLFPPQQRESLTNQTKFWKLILEHTEVRCIYSNLLLTTDNISLEHYLPWSFVAHDQLWNLIPTFPEVNSAKSNNLPSNIYFNAFVAMQHRGLMISHENIKSNIWNKYIESYIAELKITDKNDILNFEKLRNAYELIIMPQISLATTQGFTPNWFYK